MHKLRLLPIAIILVALCLFFHADLYHYLSFNSLKSHRHLLISWTDQHYILAVGCYMLCYILSVAISLPASLFFMLTAGFLFGIFPGFLYAVISAVIGSVIVFLAVNIAFAEWVEAKAGHRLKKMERGFTKNAFNYLVILRLLPIFPFWLVNIAAALLNVRLRVFVSATFFGMMPLALIYVTVGRSLGALFDSQITPTIFGVMI